MTASPDAASAPEPPIFRPGHDVHLIQAQRAFRDPGA